MGNNIDEQKGGGVWEELYGKQGVYDRCDDMIWGMIRERRDGWERGV